jgi:hypothetical protein
MGWWNNSGGGSGRDYAGEIRKIYADAVKDAQRLGDKYITDAEKYVDTATTGVNNANRYFETNSTANADQYRDAIQSLTDWFMSGYGEVDAATQTAISDFNTRSEGIATRSAQEAVDFMTANQDTFISLADNFTNAAVNTRRRLLEQSNPYIFEQQEAAGRNNLAMLRGVLPADVAAQVQRNAAAISTAGGYGAGSGAGRANAARNLGLTSLDLMRYGDESARQWADLTYRTQVEGLQLLPSAVADKLGLSSEQVLTANQRNNELLLNAQTTAGQNRLSGLNLAYQQQGSAFGNIGNWRQDTLSRIHEADWRTAIWGGETMTGASKYATQLMADALSTQTSGLAKTTAQEWQIDLNNIANAAAQKNMWVNAAVTGVGALGGFALSGGNPGGAMAGASIASGMTSGSGGGAANFGNIWGDSSIFGGGASFGLSKEAMRGMTQPGTTGTFQSWAGGWVPKATLPESGNSQLFTAPKGWSPSSGKSWFNY